MAINLANSSFVSEFMNCLWRYNVYRSVKANIDNTQIGEMIDIPQLQ